MSLCDNINDSTLGKHSTLSQFLMKIKFLVNNVEKSSVSPVLFEGLLLDSCQGLEDTSFTCYPSNRKGTSMMKEYVIKLQSQCKLGKVNEFQISNQTHQYSRFMVSIHCVRALFRRLTKIEFSILYSLIFLLFGIGLGFSIGKYVLPWLYCDIENNKVELSESMKQIDHSAPESKVDKKKQLYFAKKKKNPFCGR